MEVSRIKWKGMEEESDGIGGYSGVVWKPNTMETSWKSIRVVLVRIPSNEGIQGILTWPFLVAR